MEDLNSAESRAFNMSHEEWRSLEEDIHEKFPARTWNLIQWRYCFKCTSLRPPRAHHCSICGFCVMRMDHHCPWVGNCVGIHNHKYFINFLVHALIGCAIVSATMITEAFSVGFRKFDRNMHYSAGMMLSTALIFSLGGLLGLHTYLILTNQSTLEMGQLADGNPFRRTKLVQKTQADKKAREPLRLFTGRRSRQAGQVVPQAQPAVNRQMKSVTDFAANVKDVCGKDWHYWMLPCEPDGGMQNCDGLHWSIKEIH